MACTKEVNKIELTDLTAEYVRDLVHLNVMTEHGPHHKHKGGKLCR